MPRIRTLIVDDEPLAREGIRTLLAAEPDVEIVGECSNGLEALETLRQLRPDLAFLDVQMPGLDGFDVLAALGTEWMPAVIFVTAYDRYALKAFEVHAVDYLLKPFDRDRLRQALDRARDQVKTRAVAHRLQKLLAEVQNSRQLPERLAIKSGSGVAFLKTDRVDWIEAAGNYVKIHAGTEVHLLRETMNHLEARLDPDRFLRIHRCTIVNIDRIREVQPLFHGDCLVVLHNGTELSVSRNYRRRLFERLGASP